MLFQIKLWMLFVNTGSTGVRITLCLLLLHRLLGRLNDGPFALIVFLGPSILSAGCETLAVYIVCCLCTLMSLHLSSVALTYCSVSCDHHHETKYSLMCFDEDVILYWCPHLQSLSLHPSFCFLYQTPPPSPPLPAPIPKMIF